MKIFTINGTGKQQYLCRLADEHASFLLSKAIALQKNPAILEQLKAVTLEVKDEAEPEYDELELDVISRIVDDDDNYTIPEWPGKVEVQETTLSSSTGRVIPKRNPKRAADSLKRAKYCCEFDASDRTFVRKSGKLYTEPHHLIPMCKHREFSTSLDVMQNIVSLCSHCYNLLHYGRLDDKTAILVKLHNERKEALEKIGIKVSLEQLLFFYK